AGPGDGAAKHRRGTGRGRPELQRREGGRDDHRRHDCVVRDSDAAGAGTGRATATRRHEGGCGWRAGTSAGMPRISIHRPVRLALAAMVGVSSMGTIAEAQVRGVYPTGMNATNAGVTPASGFTYSNLFIFNARDESKGPDGELVATGSNAVMIDLNTFVWVSR